MDINSYPNNEVEMILLIGGEKDGTGKTTISTNLATIRSLDGYNVLLADAHPTKAASLWSSKRDEDNILPKITTLQKFDHIQKEILALKTKFDDIIIDAGGRDSVAVELLLCVADKAIFPLLATDLSTLEEVNSSVSDAKAINEKLAAFVMINQVSSNPSVKEIEEVGEFLRDFSELKLLNSGVSERLSIKEAIIAGKSVKELKPEDKKASSEIHALYEEVFHA
ncbi:MAG: hypothetical protein K2X39_05045 [Silvanigrellaceae bacterium]|nr:hypothetical protein [Silvanigrellaceae bacterium]